MPVSPDPVVADIRSIRIQPAPVVELFWVLHDLATGKYHQEHPVFHDRRLAERARAFSGLEPESAVCGFDEVLILAGANGLLTTPHAERLIERIPELARQPERRFAMATETEETRRRTFANLARLRADEELQKEFQALLQETWDAIKDTWESEGRTAAEQTAAALRSRAATATDLSELTSSRHWVLESPYRTLAEAAIARGEALLVPCYFSGHSLVYDLPGMFVIGIPAQTMPRAQQMRLMVQGAATRLKVLADPTRMAIVAYLSECPSTVTEIAKTFSIAQPTASAHIRMLREARLVHQVNEAGKVRYQVSREEIDHLLGKVRTSVLGPG